MNASFKQVKDIFLAALERENALDREAFLSHACADEPALRAQVNALLRRHEQAGSFLQFPSAAADPPTDQEGEESGPRPLGSGQPGASAMATVDIPITERPGMVIGAYKLMEQIGEGGMGLVFVAEQQYPVRRKVALKVIKPGMDTRAVIARFEAERQALALMDHPNIARVHDGGETSTGRPYFVMELVKGVPITLYCDQNRLTNRQRLELFIHVCEAVQHAHQKGIIHRDIKPTNVLVVSHDGTPVVKVIDFGVAKSIGQQLTDKTIYTQFVQLVGTPLYMSPEQAGESGLDVDTRSDIYSLGVLLYELLTGTTPFNKERMKEASYEEIRRMIREEEPPKPSTRISTLGQAASTISTQRRSDPSHLRQMVRGELDWIVMKALEKDRTRRYQTANGLASDVQRYLHDEPVQACPPSAAYRLSKFARKNRALLRVAAIFVAFLAIAATVSTWQAFRATMAEKQALQERDRAKESFQMARDAVDQLFTQVSQNPKLKAQPMEKFRRELLQSAKGFYENFISKQFDEPSVRHDLALAHTRLAEIDRELGDYTAAEEYLTKAIALLGELIREQPGMMVYERDLAAAYVALGGVHVDKARWPKADEAYLQALAIQEKQAEADPQTAEFRYALAKTYNASGYVHMQAKDDKAERRYQQALDILRPLVQDHPQAEYQSLLAATQVNLGELYTTTDRHDKAESPLKRAESIYEKLIRGQTDVPADQLYALGKSYALLGMVYRNRDQTDDDIAAQKKALGIFEKLAKEHGDVLEYLYGEGRCHVELANALDHSNHLDEALASIDRGIKIIEPLVDKRYLRARSGLYAARIGRAGVLAALGDHMQASKELEIAARQEYLQPVHLYNIACYYSRASAAANQDTKLSPARRAELQARYAERSMVFLRQAIDKGYGRHLNLIRKDRDLDPVRTLDDFKKILAELEAKQKESNNK
jgi:serine/threonine protein kinase/tetratricopeptide (TPR) repeat protein